MLLRAHEARAVPVVSVVGKSDSGKTTVLERLIAVLAGRGRRVATVKHHVHDFDIDVPGKDSWRHARAGAVVTMISSPDKFGVIREVSRERTLAEIVEAAGDVDILLTEGFRRAGGVRIEVSRRARSDELVCDPSELFALVTDNADLRPQGVPAFAFEEIDALADLVEATFLGASEADSAGAPAGEGSA